MSDKKRAALKGPDAATLKRKQRGILSARKAGATRRKRKARKPRTAQKEAAKFAREFHSDERVEFVRWLACVGCGGSPCDNHHVEGDGVSRKAGYEKIIPLCRPCHRAWHSMGRHTWEAMHKRDSAAAAAETQAGWAYTNQRKAS